MPIHDWSRVSAGVFHDFHVAWVVEIQRALNTGVLPEAHYGIAERAAVPGSTTVAGNEPAGQQGGIALTVAAPEVTVTETVTESLILALRRRRLLIRHACDDRIIALIEFSSPGAKARRTQLDTFVEQAVAALDRGYHLLVLDLFPPGKFDPRGLHGAIWERLHGAYAPPPDKPLTLAAYRAAGAVTCYVEPTAVGTPLIDMPLFLDPGHYVNVPLEPTYLAAYEGVPRRWKTVIEAG